MEDDEDDDMGMDENAAADETTATSSAFLPALVAPLLPLIHPTPLSFPPLSGGPSPHPPTTSALAAIHICAFECLNNIFFSLTSPRKGRDPTFELRSQADSATQVWTEIWGALEAVGTDFERPGQDRRREMWQLGVGVLWGIGIVWKGVLVRLAGSIMPDLLTDALRRYRPRRKSSC